MYLSRIEGPPPKRNAAGSTPVMDASKQRCKPLFSRVYSFFVITDREAMYSCLCPWEFPKAIYFAR